ncbi:GIY-YIG nuclease family protein [Flavobacterium sp. GNP002]
MAYIYKITSPSNKVYVGSTSNITRRWSSYRRMKCEAQRKLYSSLLKHGVDKHKFEIITECDVANMLQLETHWGLFYNVLDKKSGLNLRLPKDGEVYGGFSKERICGGDFKKGNIPHNKGIPCSEEMKKRISLKKKGRSSWNKGKKWSEESKKRMSEGSKGIITHNAKIILDINTGVFYNSSVDAAKYNSISKSSLNYMLQGVYKNKTSLRHV